MTLQCMSVRQYTVNQTKHKLNIYKLYEMIFPEIKYLIKIVINYFGAGRNFCGVENKKYFLSWNVPVNIYLSKITIEYIKKNEFTLKL